MKKRAAVSILLTILVIAATYNYWFIIHPLTFSMNVKSQNPNTIMVTTILNRKDDSSFSKSYEKSAGVNPQINKKYKLSFKHKTSPKRLRFVLKDLTPGAEYEISDIAFKDGKYLLNDLSKFISDSAKLYLKKDKLIVVPNGITAQIDYADKLKVRVVEFDIKILLIIMALSILLFYKLTSYLADFKINKNVSRLDIIFLAICVTLLFIPMFNINQDVKSEQENRNLAVYKPLIKKDKSINFDFGKDYESWISDRFGMRRFLISWYKNFKVAISTRYYMTDKAYWDKKTNWIFGRELLVVKPLTEEQIKEISDALIEFNTFCKNNNIKLYVLISPRSENIYVQHTFLKKDYLDGYGNSIDKIRQNTKIPVIYPFKELTEASKEDYVFFKTDHHWTDFGAYTGYKTLMKEIKKDYPYLKEVRREDFNISHNNLVRWDFERDYRNGYIYNFLGLPDKYRDKILDIQYNYFTHKDSKLLKIKIENNAKLAQKSFEYEKGANLKAFLIGSSPNENLTEIFPYTFKNTRFIRINKPKDIKRADVYKLIKLYKQNIVNYNPDIMVFCIQSHDLKKLKDLANEE